MSELLSSIRVHCANVAQISHLIVLMVLATISLGYETASAANYQGLELGVIRWDAWVGDLSGEGLVVEQTMSPNQYHDRLPFYGVELGPSSVQVRATTQAVIDAEIAYARRAGISFWAFVRYEHGLRVARDLYESSSVKGDLKFANIIDAGNNQDFAALVADFAKPYYQKVVGNRPLLFILSPSSTSYSRAQIDGLRSLTVASGVANPYIVILDGNRGRAESLADYLAADATSAYVTSGRGGYSFANHMNAERGLWNARVNYDRKSVPWVTAGWDARPRVTTPVPWVTYPSDSWVQRATPEQVAQQLQAALDWRAANPGSTEPAIVLMYAWNEFDEGGWICPTHAEGTARIDAISDVMRYSASSSWDKTQTARKAFDGSASTWWQAALGSPISSQWLEIDFRVESTFSQVYLSEWGNRTGHFRIQYRAGSEWRTAYSGYGIGESATFNFPAVRSRRARIQFDSGVYTPIIFEFQLNNTPAAPNANLAANRSYKASSQWAGGAQGPEYAFDANPSTNWQAAAGSAFGNQWLEINFGDVTTFNTVTLSEYGYRTWSYRIEYWANGWHTAYTGYGIGDSTQVSFPSITSTAVRIRFLSGAYTPIIYEFGVYFQ